MQDHIVVQNARLYSSGDLGTSGRNMFVNVSVKIREAHTLHINAPAPNPPTIAPLSKRMPCNEMVLMERVAQ